MKKRILPLIMLILIGFAMLCPVCVSAATPLDPNADASLTLYYQKGDRAFENLQVGIYRVAEAFPNGTFELIEPFALFPINIHSITAQEQWHIVAETLCSYIVANQVKPDREAVTDAKGTVYFPELETGLYFVREVVAESSDGTYVFNQFMIYVPTPQPDGSFDYSVEAKPKCTNFVPKTQYTVTKLWKDEGYQHLRPKEVAIDIYKDGVLHETKILSASNNWTYTWFVSADDYGIWAVAEPIIKDPYKVMVQQNGNNFLVISTCQSKPDVPQTGDSFALLPWVLAMGFSGIMLLILGIYGRRSR